MYNKVTDDLGCSGLRIWHCSTKGESAKWIGSSMCHLSGKYSALIERDPQKTSLTALCVYGINKGAVARKRLDRTRKVTN